MEEEQKRKNEEQRRKKMEEEQSKLDEERRKLQQERLRMEAENNRKMEQERMSYYERKSIPDNSEIYEKGKQDILEQMKYLKEKTQRIKDEIRKFEIGQKELEEESMRIRQEEMERERLRSSRAQKSYNPLSYKDTETKTFYTGYVQQKYISGGQSFPERNMSYNQYGNRICLDCGKIKLFDS